MKYVSDKLLQCTFIIKMNAWPSKDTDAAATTTVALAFHLTDRFAKVIPTRTKSTLVSLGKLLEIAKNIFLQARC